MAKLNITWPYFLYCNDNPTEAFEDMCRRLFIAEYLKGKKRPHTDHNTPGVEVLPILEPERDDGQPLRRISFQAKFVDSTSSGYSKIKESAIQTVKHHKGNLDLVYLFCNKTLTTTSKTYKDIVNIYQAAGIETVPISNVDLLDMINDYPDIAEYFFQKRRAADIITPDELSDSGLSIDKIIESLSSGSGVIQQQSIGTGLAKELIAEKLELCKKYALSMKLDSLEQELQKLFSHGQSEFEGAGTAYFYSLLLKLHKGIDFDADLNKCDIYFYSEAKWIIDFYRTTKTLSAEEFISHSPLIQIFIVDRMFAPEHWQDIIALWKTVKDHIDPSIKPQFDLYYGLSLFNIQEYEKAGEVLHALVETSNDERVRFYACITDILFENSFYQTGMEGHHQKLADLLSELDSYFELNQYQQQKSLVTAIKMETLYHLGISEKRYLDRAIEEYKELPELIHNNEYIRFYYALCLELSGKKEDASEIYASLNWENDPSVAERYMICNILNDHEDTALSIYSSIDQKNSLIEAIFLLALKRSNADNYIGVFQETLNRYESSLEDVITIAYYTDGCDTAKSIVLPRLIELSTEEQLKALPIHSKINMIVFLSQCGEIILLESVLKTIEDVSAINSYAVGEIYRALFDTANREYANEEKRIDKPLKFEAVERIADAFLATGQFKKYFLQIKVLCAGAKRMPFSSLKYSKELFEITHDEEMARNIVALLFDRKIASYAEYAPYMEVLERSEKPDCCMAAATASLMLGKEDAADYHAYRALYYLNDKDDYKIYKSFFGFCSYNLRAYQHDASFNSVKGSKVLTLEELTTDEQPPRLIICLDSEAELSYEGNHSMGIDHLTPSAPDYIKLCGCGLNQVIKIRGKNYKIIHIASRVQYGWSYVFKKIQEKPEMFRDSVWVITTKDTGEMLKQMKELTDNTEQINTLLTYYHFKDNNIGIPIDVLVSGNYDKYIDAVRYLLFQKNEAYYAGPPINEDETGKRYVPSLSTLVLLAVLGRIDVMEAFKEQIIIPDSYLRFIQAEYSNAVISSNKSTTTLFFVEDKPVLQEMDKTIPELWENILVFCKTCVTESITDQERIDSSFANEISGEQFFSDMKISFIHLDALLLAKKEKATLLCDDLFFRKMATSLNIRSVNIVSLIQHYTDLDYSVPLIKELSKTNYIYIPILYRNDEEFCEIVSYLTDGEKKDLYYGDIFRRFFEVRDQIMKQLFGDN